MSSSIACGPASRREAAPNPMLHDRLNDRENLGRDAQGFEIVEILADIQGRRGAAASLCHDLQALRGKLIHHDAPVFAVSDLDHERGDRLARQLDSCQALSFGIWLHLADELCVAALGLDDGDDTGDCAARVPGHEPVGNVSLSDRPATVGELDGVLLHEHPTVSAFSKRLHELVADVRVVGQGHFGGGEPAHATQGLQPEDRREVVLPSLHVQAIVLRGGRGRHGMAVPPENPVLVAGKGHTRYECSSRIRHDEPSQNPN